MGAEDFFEGRFGGNDQVRPRQNLTDLRAGGAIYGGGENHAFGAFVTRVRKVLFMFDHCADFQ
jgi:hypothetical protein